MQSLSGLVKLPEVTIKLHWPSPGCPDCAGECELIGHEIYECESCYALNEGYNKYVGAEVRLA